jgi:hypothetical protein
MIFEKKAINTIVGLSLLFLFSIFLFLLLAGWFDTYTSSLETDLEAKDFPRNIEILLANGSHVFVQNTFRDDLFVNEVYINGRNCTTTAQEVDLTTKAVLDLTSTCTEDLANGSAYEVILVTSVGSYSEYEIFYNLT